MKELYVEVTRICTLPLEGSVKGTLSQTPRRFIRNEALFKAKRALLEEFHHPTPVLPGNQSGLDERSDLMRLCKRWDTLHGVTTHRIAEVANPTSPVHAENRSPEGMDGSETSGNACFCLYSSFPVHLATRMRLNNPEKLLENIGITLECELLAPARCLGIPHGLSKNTPGTVMLDLTTTPIARSYGEFLDEVKPDNGIDYLTPSIRRLDDAIGDDLRMLGPDLKIESPLFFASSLKGYDPMFMGSRKDTLAELVQEFLYALGQKMDAREREKLSSLNRGAADFL